MKKISGKYVYLKDIDLTEHEKIYEIRHNSKLNKYINEISNNKKDQKKFIKNQKDLGNYFFGIYRKSTNQFLGTISIYNISKLKIAEWGRWISIGTSRENLESLYLLINYGFKKLLLKKIFAKTISNNKKVVSLHKKLGFKTMQINKYDAFIRNTYHDTYVTELKKVEIKKFNNLIKKFL